MKYYFITGTTSGIGYALVESLLGLENVVVYGISRRQSWNHASYIPVTIDLSKPDEVSNYLFPELKDAEQIVLINNAGQIGDIKPIGKADNAAIVDLMNVNVTAPAIFMNNFIERYANQGVEKIVLNVSSGAGKSAIKGWAPYCGSKAAIDLLSLTTFEEQKSVDNPVIVYAIAPGVVDTEMQVAIRKSNESDFSRHAHFVGLKENNELTSPKEVAQKYLRILNTTSEFKECVFSLRNVD